MKKATIVTPQFERIRELDFQWKPENAAEFLNTVESAPWDILLGLGFCKWEQYNQVCWENAQKPEHQHIEIPILNADESISIDVGRKSAPVTPIKGNPWIMLIPGEWYDLIPDGYTVYGLYGEKQKFKKGESDNDIRFGCLPYGILRVIQ